MVLERVLLWIWGMGELANEIGWTSWVKHGRTVGDVGGLGEKGEKYPQSPRARKGLCKWLPLSAHVHKQNNFVRNEDILILKSRREFIVSPLIFFPCKAITIIPRV